MHELDIVSAILDRALAASDEHRKARVTRIGLRIGELAGVEPDALSFGFELLCRSTPAEGAVLEIELCKRTYRCAHCGLQFEPEATMTACPACRSDDCVCVAGRELDVMFIEMEEAQCA